MKSELIRIALEELGPSATTQDVIDWLDTNGVLSYRWVRPFVITSAFWKQMKGNGKSGYDAEQEVAALYNITHGAVRVIRLRHARRIHSARKK
jgi:hypothetical protein